MSPVSILRNERGVALPMALIVPVALTTLMVAFAVLVQAPGKPVGSGWSRSIRPEPQ